MSKFSHDNEAAFSSTDCIISDLIYFLSNRDEATLAKSHLRILTTEFDFSGQFFLHLSNPVEYLNALRQRELIYEYGSAYSEQIEFQGSFKTISFKITNNNEKVNNATNLVDEDPASVPV